MTSLLLSTFIHRVRDKCYGTVPRAQLANTDTNNVMVVANLVNDSALSNPIFLLIDCSEKW